MTATQLLARLSIVGAFTFQTQACEGRDPATTRDTAATSGGAIGTDTAPRAEPAAADDTGAPPAATCDVDAGTLTGNGIGALRVGARVEEISRACRVTRDATGPGPEGSTERRIVVDLGRDTVSAVIDEGRVWRVHVQTSAFRTADSLGVGTTGRELRRPGAQVLAGEGKHFVRLANHCGLSFRLRGVQFGRVRTVTQIPDTAAVDEVLAVGCGA